MTDSARHEGARRDDRCPQPPPGGWLRLEFPERFRLDVRSEGEWVEWGSYERRHVAEVEGEENVWVAAAGGMPIYFRCVEKREGELDSIAGTGKRITYRLVDLGAVEEKTFGAEPSVRYGEDDRAQMQPEMP